MSSKEDRNNPEAGQDSRRERGKLAQRAYRKRHANKFQSLQDENQRLKDAIRDIGRIASRHNDIKQDLAEVIAQAQAVAGLKKEEPEVNDISMPDEEQTAPNPSADQDAQPSSSLTLVPRNNSEPSFDTIYFSPSISQTLWLDTDYLFRTFDAPADVAPFLGDGMFTIAGCLYWACITYTVSLWEESDRLGATGRLDPRPLDRIFSHSKHLTDRAFLASLARARLEYKKKGFVARKSILDSSTDRNHILRLPLLVRQEYEQRGERLAWWKRPQDVESYVKKHLCPGDVAAMQIVAQDRGSGAAFEKYRSLIASLAQDFVCFGDGPRWNALHVSMTIGGWLEKHQALRGA